MKKFAFPIQLLLGLAILSLGLGLTSCKKNQEGTKPLAVTGLTVEPSQLELYPGETVQLTTKKGKEPVMPTYTSQDTDIIFVDSEGRAKAGSKTGETTIQVSLGELKAEVSVKVLPIAPMEPFMPYMRAYDGLEAIIKYEEARGHKLVNQDSAMGSVSFAMTREEGFYFTRITYVDQIAVQIYTKGDTLNSPELMAWLAERGYTVNESATESYKALGMKHITVLNIPEGNPAISFAFISHYMHESFQVLPGINFVAQSALPVSEEIIAEPYQQWGASPKEVAMWEAKRGFMLNGKREPEGKPGREIYIFASKKNVGGLGPDSAGYTYLNAPRYAFQDGKLIGVTQLIAPAQHLIQPQNEGFMLSSTGEAFILEHYPKKSHFTPHGSKNNIILYDNPTERKKIYLENWRIRFKNLRLRCAGIVYLPYDGPDYLTLE